MTYEKMVRTLIKDKRILATESNPYKWGLIHAVMGIAGEAGELLDQVKKNVIYNHELDMDNVVEELGDLEFYMEAIRQELKLDREMILQENRSKLAKRYGEEYFYSDEASKKRADKQ